MSRNPGSHRPDIQNESVKFNHWAPKIPTDNERAIAKLTLIYISNRIEENGDDWIPDISDCYRCYDFINKIVADHQCGMYGIYDEFYDYWKEEDPQIVMHHIGRETGYYREMRRHIPKP